MSNNGHSGFGSGGVHILCGLTIDIYVANGEVGFSNL